MNLYFHPLQQLQLFLPVSSSAFRTQSEVSSIIAGVLLISILEKSLEG